LASAGGGSNASPSSLKKRIVRPRRLAAKLNLIIDKVTPLFLSHPIEISDTSY